jgi:hypothetical protein
MMQVEEQPLPPYGANPNQATKLSYHPERKDWIA